MSTTMIVILAVAAVVALWGISAYNGFIKLWNLTKEGWSGIETQLKRRADLIPNIVETVKGYAAHEKGTFEAVTKMRAQASGVTDPAERAKIEGQMSAMIGKIMAIAEAYPELKANENFLALQKELSGVEEQLNLSRRYYNGAARNFNTSIQSFPANVIAGVTGFKSADYFEIENPADREAPKVAFGG